MTARDDGRAAAQAMLRTDPLSEDSINLIADKVMDAYAPGRRAEVIAEIAAVLQVRIDRDRAYWPQRSNDRTALCGAREIVLGLLEPVATPTACPHVREGCCCSGPGYCCHACEPTGEAS